MSVDTELEMWRSEWQSAVEIPPDLRKRVDRQTRFMKLALLNEILVTLVVSGGATVWALGSGVPGGASLVTVTWIYTAVAWAVSLQVNRGNWAPASQDTAAFVDLSMRRCRARLAAVWFAAVLYVFQAAFVLGWVYRHSPEPQPPLSKWLWFGSAPIDAVWFCTVAFFAFLIWFRRHKRRELLYLESLQEDL